MIALFTFLISMLLAVLALRGWPVESGIWMRALLALVFLMIGTAVMLFAKAPELTKRLIGSRKLRAGDQLVTGLCLATLIALFYFILVFAPPATSELSIRVVAAVKERLGWDGQASPAGDDDELISSGEYQMEVGGLFDPNGAIVPKTADLNPSPEPAVSLKMPSRGDCDKLRANGPVYLHLFSHHVFDGDRWTSPTWAASTKLKAGPDGLIRLNRDPPAAQYRYTILRHEFSNGMDALCTLQGVREVGLPVITQLNEGTWLLPPPDNPFGIIRPYQASSVPRSFPQLLAKGETIQAGFAGSDYLAPSENESLNQLIGELADAFKRNSSLEEQLSDLHARMSNSFVYSMQLDYPDKEKSALESFLENPGTSKGFCVHFASATALILRKLGVHSRVSYGWAGGEYFPGHNLFVFQSKHGHAWAEIYLKGHGWVVFDTTPPSGRPDSAMSPDGATPPGSGSAIEVPGSEDPGRGEQAHAGDSLFTWSSPILR